jgi:hypothetical protein
MSSLLSLRLQMTFLVVQLRLDRWWQQNMDHSYTTLSSSTSFVSLARFQVAPKWLLCESGDLHRMFGLCSILQASSVSLLSGLLLNEDEFSSDGWHLNTGSLFFVFCSPYYRHFSSRLHFQNRLKGSMASPPPPPWPASSTQCNDVLDEVLLVPDLSITIPKNGLSFTPLFPRW